MKLSIIVPVYNMNHDNLLQFCLDSLVNQTIEDYEIIAVNDASTDDSLEILRKYESDYPDLFKIITYSQNKKQGGAKNEGLKIATGDWIGFIDSDDWVTPDFYEKLINKAELTGADCVGCNYSTVDKHTFDIGNVVINNYNNQCGVLDDSKRKMLLKQFGSMVTKIYKREMIVSYNLNFPENIFYEDNCAAPIWCMYIKHFELVNEPLYFYYQHNSSTVHHITVAKCYDRMTAYEIMINEMDSRGFKNKYSDELEDLFTRIYLINTLFGYMQSGHKDGIKPVKQLKKGILKEFPGFRNNPNYSPDKEEEKMINLLMKGSLLFYIYYNLLWFYRNKIQSSQK